jgi:oxygen-independent coproporphyrinogen III oxidase
MKKELQIYIHIPFCIRRCRWCAACVVTGDASAKERYLAALERELWAALPALEPYLITGLKVGGGTPSVMNPDGLARLIRRFKKEIDLKPYAQVELEMVPQTVCTASLTGLGGGGFNRISLSMQSAVDSELVTLDSGFNVEQLYQAVLFLKRFHCNDVNLDLMCGIPGQTASSWEQTLHTVRDLAPAHVSVYPLSEVSVAPITDAAREGSLLARADEFLSELGFERYTRYHFAKNAHASAYVKHRIEGGGYRGFGLGARSFIGGELFTNTDDWNDYLAYAGDPDRLRATALKLAPEQLGEYRCALDALSADSGL